MTKHLSYDESHMNCDRIKPVLGFPTRSDTNWPVQSQMKARSLKVCKEVGEELYLPCSENKGADAQLICAFVCA